MTIALGKFTKDENDLFDIMAGWLKVNLVGERESNILELDTNDKKVVLIVLGRVEGSRT